MKSELGPIQRLARLYTFYSPIRKGKYRLAFASLGLARRLPEQIEVKTVDGRTLRVNFGDQSSQIMYFLGEYERAVTKLVRGIVHPKDFCLDIGANIGWYTTLLQTIVGPKGRVHAFEPVPPTFELLKMNVNANSNSEVVSLNNFALGDSEKDVELHVFDNLPDGHASVSDFGRSDLTKYPARMKTLDSYVGSSSLDCVNFVKMDIEGAELSMLAAASSLFSQEIPPIFVIEMALATTRAFGYVPNDIIDFIGANREYEFYAVDENTLTLDAIEGFPPGHAGANVLCVPKGHYRERLGGLSIN